MKSNNVNHKQTKESIEEEKKINRPSKKKKGPSIDYSRFKDQRYIENDISHEDLTYLTKFIDEITYESLQISDELTNKDHDMESIKLFKKKVRL